MPNYEQTVLALSPDSYWRCNEPSGTTLVDIIGGKNLTITGTPSAFGVSSGLVGVTPGIDFGPINTSYAKIATPLTQIASNKFGIGGWFYWNGGYGTAFASPAFCASFSGGHVDPFYIFFAGVNASSQWRLVIDTGGSFSPFDTGVAMPSQNGWHLVWLSYNGAGGGSTKLFVDDVAVVSSAFTAGNLHDTMGSFAINTIPASSSNQAPLKASSVAYFHDYAPTQSDIDAMWAARNDPGTPQVLQRLRPLASRFA